MTITRISSGTTSSGLFVREGNQLTVLSGGVAIDTIVFGGGTLAPAAGGIVENVDVRKGASVIGGGAMTGSNTVEGGSVAGVTLAGELTVSAGRTASVKVASGGVEVISKGAVASGGVVSGGGILDLEGSHVGAGEVLSGARLDLVGNGAGMIVESGGAVEFGGAITSTLVYSGPAVGVATALDGATLSSGATLDLVGATLVSGAVLSLTADAVVRSVTIKGGTLIGQGAVDSLTLFSGFVSGADVLGQLVIDAFGSARDDTIGVGAIELVGFGAAVSGETILRLGEMNIETSDSATGTLVKGGTVFVQGIGFTSASVLSSGGREVLLTQAEDAGTRILAGGIEIVSGVGGAAAFGSLISSGGLEVVRGVKAETYGATVFSGGTLSVVRGRVGSGLTLDGGTAIISGGVSAGQTVSFGSAGTLELGNLSGFQASISGMTTSAQKVDLDGFAVSAGESVTWVQSGTSGTLTVTDGAKVANLTLIGTYATSDFKLADDGHGGTFVFDPRKAPRAPAATQLVQAAAGLHGGRHSADITVAHGGGVVANAQPLVAAISGR